MVVAAMREHPDAEEVQHAGCMALRRVGYCDDCSLHVVRAGGLEAIVSAMQAHTDMEEVQEACVQLLL